MPILIIDAKGYTCTSLVHVYGLVLHQYCNISTDTDIISPFQQYLYQYLIFMAHRANPMIAFSKA